MNGFLDHLVNGEADILLGTQMIAKGLDFPNITLVGVLSADTLYIYLTFVQQNNISIIDTS